MKRTAAPRLPRVRLEPDSFFAAGRSQNGDSREVSDAPRSEIPPPRPIAANAGVYLTEGAPRLLKWLAAFWAIASLFYIVFLVFLMLFYFYAPPWDTDITLFPPHGSPWLWTYLAVAMTIVIARVLACYTIVIGQRGSVAVRVGWSIFLASLVAQIADWSFSLARWARGIGSSFTPLPLMIVAVATLVVALMPRCLEWVWTRGERHRPELAYTGHFPSQQAEQLGITPPKELTTTRGTDFTKPAPTSELTDVTKTPQTGAPYASSRPARPTGRLGEYESPVSPTVQKASAFAPGAPEVPIVPYESRFAESKGEDSSAEVESGAADEPSPGPPDLPTQAG